MADILDVLEDWGCDIDEGLTRLGGDEDFYRILISEFSRENGMDALEKAMNSRDYHLAFELAHGLKGDTGNLSLTPLYRAVCVLVEDLRPVGSGNPPLGTAEQDYEAVREQFAEFMKKGLTH